MSCLVGSTTFVSGKEQEAEKLRIKYKYLWKVQGEAQAVSADDGGHCHWADDKCLNSMEKTEHFAAENVDPSSASVFSS